MKLANRSQAIKELESYQEYLNEKPSEDADVVGMLADLLMDHPSIAELHRALGDEYKKQGKTEDAINKFDKAAEIYIEAGNKESAIESITRILSMNPPNAEEYQQVLAQIEEA